ncbi:metalloregulator ArsR/SmtB family transcription factor [Rhodococcus sp. D-6]|uniref:Winged helix-turn-helix transcriptional regulator n=2 Tax=Rhodococcus TaxID=1827 RepID=A0A7M2XXX1_9NOCA|nr:metalloregulator ArsR/SmtB family transcription factor [Rhodococcus pyridinivorans]QOW01921.1 winged helix-turn-helix transcriptional regulator [Rhodococcus pyridinivorans]
MPTRTVAAPTTDEDLQQWSRRFDLLADPNRLRILHHLHHEPDLCISDLADAVGMRPTALSQALRLLREQGWVAATRQGRLMRYRLVDATVHSLLHTVGADHQH